MIKLVVDPRLLSMVPARPRPRFPSIRRSMLFVRGGLYLLLLAMDSPHPTIAAGSVAAGGATFRRQCSICHSATPGRNMVGPSLFGVFGRVAGRAPGFNYSPAMQSSGLVWTESTLSDFLASPSTKVPGTKMTFPGLPSADQIDDTIAFLKSLKAPAN
jgi:cytochrome c